MKTSDQGIELIKSLEGCSLKAYPDAGGYSVGYGHYGVEPGLVITQDEAEELLRGDLYTAERAVERYCAGLNQAQFDALVSLCYNIGSGNFAGSTVVRLIREGGPQPRAELRTAWQLWNKSRGKVLDALVRRRNLEYDHYCQNDGLKKKTDSGNGRPPIDSGHRCRLK